MAPENYAHEAGWELDVHGGKRLLFHPECFQFEVFKTYEQKDQGTHPAVTILKADNQSCPWCSSNLTVLFDYDLQHPLVQFMKLEGQRLRIAVCMHCNCYGTVFMNVNLNGAYNWSEYNSVPTYLPEPLPDTQSEEPNWRALRLSDQSLGTYHSACWTLEVPASQIGGHPAWIQDAEYPSCPCCSETMKFVAQIDMEQAGNSEGIYYAFLCGTCLITAVQYQQT